MATNVNITKRERHRRLKSGQVVTQVRWVINYREPQTGQRRQLFYERAQDAQTKRNEIITEISNGQYSHIRKAVTVAEVMERWLGNRRGDVKAGTLGGYEHYKAYIVGPLLTGTKADRAEYAVTGKRPP